PPHLPSFPTRRSSDLAPAPSGRAAGLDRVHDQVQDDLYELAGDARHPERAGDLGRDDRSRAGLSPGEEQGGLHRPPHVEDIASPDRKSTRLNSSHVAI